VYSSSSQKLCHTATENSHAIWDHSVTQCYLPPDRRETVRYASGQKDRQIYRHTDMLIAILRTATGGKVITNLNKHLACLEVNIHQSLAHLVIKAMNLHPQQ